MSSRTAPTKRIFHLVKADWNIYTGVTGLSQSEYIQVVEEWISIRTTYASWVVTKEALAHERRALGLRGPSRQPKSSEEKTLKEITRDVVKAMTKKERDLYWDLVIQIRRTMSTMTAALAEHLIPQVFGRSAYVFQEKFKDYIYVPDPYHNFQLSKFKKKN